MRRHSSTSPDVCCPYKVEKLLEPNCYEHARFTRILYMDNKNSDKFWRLKPFCSSMDHTQTHSTIPWQNQLLPRFTWTSQLLHTISIICMCKYVILAAYKDFLRNILAFLGWIYMQSVSIFAFHRWMSFLDEKASLAPTRLSLSVRQ